jgi:fatty-acyl-CoA synthase
VTVIVDAVATHARARRDLLAMVDLASGRRWSWRALDRSVNQVAHWLTGALGPSSGARVATLARNADWMVVLQLACVRAGAIFVPFNWRLAEAELRALTADASPVVLFHDAEFPLDLAPRCLVLNDLAALTADQPDTALPIEARQLWDAPSTLLYTSGTSGRPKGVMISEANAFFGCSNFINGNRVSCDSVFLCDMPLFHTAGLFAATRSPVQAGACVLISKGFDPAVTLARLADPLLGITHYFSVPQMAQMLWNQPGFDPAALTRLEVYATGGAPNPKVQIERFVSAGVPMSDGFGMSETCSNFAMPVEDRALMVEKAGSIGMPLLMLDVRIVDDDGVDMADGETGELWLRGPSITKGYWNQPELTAKAFHDGWFKTGDAARRDADGFYYLVDRKKDMFISGGENVYPAEIEAVVAELASVAECAVIGVPDEKWGEVGHAVVIPVGGSAIEADAILSHCRARLAAFKVPKSVAVVSEIPRTASGKVQKHILREMMVLASSPE